MLFKDYYKILGYETSKVTIDDIKIGFREQAKKYHPDKNEGNAEAEERFKDINEAYRILSNPSSRRKYDRSWNYNIGRAKNKETNAKNMKSSETIIGEAFNMFFGSKKEKKKEEIKTNKKTGIKGDNIETGINVTIEEAFFGSSKKISLRAVDRNNEKFYSKNSSRNKKWGKNKTNRARKNTDKMVEKMEIYL